MKADPSAAQNAETQRRFLWPNAQQERVLEAAIANDSKAIAAFRDWCRDVDFEAPIDLGTLSVLPLVYRRMVGLGVETDAMPRLKGVYRHAWYETQALFHDALPILKTLSAEGVELLFLKGAPLRDIYYKGHGLRPMNDIDIVVRRPDLPRAVARLKDAGWVLDRTAPDWHLDYYQSMEFANSGGRVIDLHVHFLIDACNAASDTWFWKSSLPFDFFGIPARRLNSTAMLFQVVLHGSRPNPFPPMRWIADAMMILHKDSGEIRWPALVEFAASQRLSHRLRTGLAYLANRFDAPIPADVLVQLGRSRMSRTERIERAFLLDMKRTPSVTGKLCLSLAFHARRSRDQGLVGAASGYLRHAILRLGYLLKNRMRKAPA
jgi:Uncharacterised nucleotidyltransferase